MSSPITTHILDTALGRPASDVDVTLDFSEDGETWNELGRGKTNADGRVLDLLDNPSPDDGSPDDGSPDDGSPDDGSPDNKLRKGAYRLRFRTQPYFEHTGRSSFYPSVTVEFYVDATDEHYHVPLLLNPFGYSTYRGS